MFLRCREKQWSVSAGTLFQVLDATLPLTCYKVFTLMALAMSETDNKWLMDTRNNTHTQNIIIMAWPKHKYVPYFLHPTLSCLRIFCCYRHRKYKASRNAGCPQEFISHFSWMIHNQSQPHWIVLGLLFFSLFLWSPTAWNQSLEK